jgi:pseudo-rSAM protein
MAQICEEGSELSIPVSFPVEEKEFENLVTLITGINISPDFTFIIETEENIAQAQALISRFDIETYSFSPHFNGKNLPFFEKYVFITRASILESKPSITGILSRGAVNFSHSGKITILSNGDLYSNLNLDKMGNITGESLHKIFYRQLKAGKSSSLYKTWWRTREQVIPCKHCHYNLLCPSMSNYELSIGRNNLCHIWEKS